MARLFPVLMLFLLALAGCASPARNLTDQQIVDLSDDQLCIYHQNYRSEPRVDAEIAYRGVNCNRFYRRCLREGIQPGTQAMAFCMDMLRENERLEDQQLRDRMDVFDYPSHSRRLKWGI